MRVVSVLLLTLAVLLVKSKVVSAQCSAYSTAGQACDCWDDSNCGLCFFDASATADFGAAGTADVNPNTWAGCQSLASVTNAIPNGIRTGANGCLALVDTNGDPIPMRFDARVIAKSDCESAMAIMAIIGPAAAGAVVVTILFWFFTRGRWWFVTNNHCGLECALWCITLPFALCVCICENEHKKKERQEREQAEKKKRGKTSLCFPKCCFSCYDFLQPTPGPHDFCYCFGVCGTTNKNQMKRVAFLYPRNPCGCLPCCNDDARGLHPCGLGCACLCSRCDKYCCEDTPMDETTVQAMNNVEMQKQAPGNPHAKE